jgi:hypothetical protein
MLVCRQLEQISKLDVGLDCAKKNSVAFSFCHDENVAKNVWRGGVGVSRKGMSGGGGWLLWTDGMNE